MFNHMCDLLLLYVSLLVMMSEAWRSSVVKIAMPTATASGMPLAETLVNTGRLHLIRSALVEMSKTRTCPAPFGFEPRCPMFSIAASFLQSPVS